MSTGPHILRNPLLSAVALVALCGGLRSEEFNTREYSVFSSEESDPAMPYQEFVSREYSVFSSDESDPDQPYVEYVSREYSVYANSNPPVAVTGLGASTSTAGYGSVDLNWSGYESLVLPDVVGYRIYAETSSFSDVSLLTPVAFVAKGQYATALDGLAGNQTYYFAVAPEDVAGNFTAAVNVASAQSSVGALGEVLSLTGSSGESMMSFDWLAPVGAAAFLDGYRITFDGQWAGVLGVGETSWARAGLQPATGHSFKVSTVDVFGNLSAGITVDAATLLPHPTDLRFSLAGGDLILEWDGVAAGALVQHYAILQGGVPVMTVTGTSVNLGAYAGLVGESFSVEAVNLLGDSAVGAPALVVPVESAPMILGNSPLLVTAFVGQVKPLGVGVSGFPPPNSQWYAGLSGDTSSLVVGETEDVFDLVVGSGASSYWVRASNTLGDADSSTFWVTGVVPQVAVEEPVSVPLVVGENRDFGEGAAGLSVEMKTFTVRNTGVVNLTLSSLVLDDTLGPDFSLDATGLASALAPGAVTTFSVTFAPLSEGEQTAVLTLLSNDGDDESFVVNLSGSGRTVEFSNAKLALLGSSEAPLVPTFKPLGENYQMTVPFAVSSLMLTPVAEETLATIEVGGVAVSSGVESLPIALSVGSNPILVEVTSQDASTMRTYTVTVTRLPETQVTTGLTGDVNEDPVVLNGLVTPNGSAEVFFEYGSDTNYGAATVTQYLSGTVEQAVVDGLGGLAEGATYHYRLVAVVDAVRYEGADGEFIKSPRPALAYTGAAAEITDSTATLQGTVAPGSLDTDYHFEFGVTDLYGSQTTPGTILAGSGPTDVSGGVSGLLSEGVYHFRVVAVNALGTVYGGDVVFQVDFSNNALSSPTTAPVVTTGGVSGVGVREATLLGVVNAAGGTTFLEFEYGVTTAYGRRTKTQGVGNTESAAAVALVAEGLLPGQTYHYRITARNSLGISVGLDGSFQTLFEPPVATTGAVEVLDTTSVLVDGAVRARGTVSAVYVEFGTHPEVLSQRRTATPGTVNGYDLEPVAVALTELSDGVRYYYRVCAESSEAGVGLGKVLSFSIDGLSGLDQEFPEPVAEGDRDAEVTVNLTYTVAPPSGVVGAWRFYGEHAWRLTGEMATGLTPGDRIIEFRPLPGYGQPPSEVLTIASGDMTVLDPQYQHIGGTGNGSLRVVLKPASMPVEPGWRFLGETTWRYNSTPGVDPTTGLQPGNYIIEGEPVTAFATPLPVNVRVFASAESSVTLTYTIAEEVLGALPSTLSFEDLSVEEVLPYPFVGQLRSNAGRATGFVVRPSVVATAGHVVFDDGTFATVKGLQWLFQLHRGVHEPKPQVPRGFYLMSGYADQRIAEATPGVSAPESQNLDMAALYFQGPAGRGGFSGYLASDLVENEYLLSDADKILVGYPIEGIAGASRNLMHATAPANIEFVAAFGETYTSSEIRSSGGNSGGPVCVLDESGSYYPAAIYLGGTGQTVVRSIDSEVVSLFGFAEASGGGVAAGAGLFAEATSSNGMPGSASLEVFIEPAGAVLVGAGWRINALNDYEVSGARLDGLVEGVTYTIQLSAVPGYELPAASDVTVDNGDLLTVTFTYEELVVPPVITSPSSLTVLVGSFSTAPIVDGLTAYWNLDQNLADSAHGLPGSASAFNDVLSPADGHSGAYGPGLFGSGGYLGSGPGTGQFNAAISDDLWGSTNNITVSWWGRVAGFSTSWQAGVANGEGERWRFHRKSNTNTIDWQGGGGGISGATDINDGAWHHFVGTKDSTLGRVLYVDGIEVASDPGTTLLEIGATPVMIGNNPDAANRNWNGDVDDVAIWNRALSEAEVVLIHSNGAAGSSLEKTALSGLSYEITASNSPTAYSLAGSLPSGVVFDPSTGIISGISLESGLFEVTVGATNAGGADSKEVVLKVLPTLEEQVAEFERNVVGSHQLLGSESEGELVFAADGLPAGLGLDVATGIISGTPLVAGEFEVVCTVTRRGATSLPTVVPVYVRALDEPPVFVLQPEEFVSVEYGLGTTLVAEATGAPVIRYQWYEGAQCNTNNPVFGATSPTFVTPPLTDPTTFWVMAYSINGLDHSEVSSITITSSTDAALVDLEVSEGALVPLFNPGILDYTVELPNPVATVEVIPTVAVNQTVVTVDGVGVSSGAASASVGLVVGNTLIEVLATAGDGSLRLYTITVTRHPAPVVVTGGATLVDDVSAVLNGTVDTVNGARVFFEYGPTTAYGFQTPEKYVPGTGVLPVAATAYGLVGGMPYHYRLCVVNGAAILHGADQSFVTTAPRALVSTGSPVGIVAESAVLVGATLVGAVNPLGIEAFAFFRYRPVGGSWVETAPQSVGSGAAIVDFTAVVGGLMKDGNYEVQIVATRAGGLDPAEGEWVAFTAVVGGGGDGVVDAAPSVTTGVASDVGVGEATLNAMVNANDGSTVVYFEYGTDTSYGSVTEVVGIGNGTTAGPVAIDVEGLLEGTLYHFRVVAENSLGTTLGSDASFTTSYAAPVVTTGGAEALSSTRALLMGEVDVMGATIPVSFEYGIDGVSFPDSEDVVGSPVGGTGPQAVSAEVTGLTEGEIYYYRLKAGAPGFEVYGAVRQLNLEALLGVDQQPPRFVELADRSGAVMVDLLPAGVGNWRFEGERVWRDSGDLVTGMRSGQRVVVYRPVAGWNAPPEEVIGVVSGAGTVSVVGQYFVAGVAGSASLKVNLGPTGVAGAAQWRLLGDEDATWLGSGVSLVGLERGRQLIEVKPVAGWGTPVPRVVDLEPGVLVEVTMTYPEASSVPGVAPSVITFDASSAATELPYAHVGQLETAAGSFSGVVVKPRVVATAAQTVFDEETLSFVPEARWYHQRESGVYEPSPQTPRGYYVFEGYEAQRAVEASPQELSLQSQNLNVAALYFYEDAGRGGYAGFLASDEVVNEFVTSSEQKTLVGYPVETVSAADRGRMHATALSGTALVNRFGHVYGDAANPGGPGFLGGPLFVQYEDGRYYPAAIFVGTGTEGRMRVIDSEVVDLFVRAAVSANGGDNQVGGGITHTSFSTFSSTASIGAIEVTLELNPPPVSGSGAWGLSGGSITRASGTKIGSRSPGDYVLEFQEVVGFLMPASQVVEVRAGETTAVTFTYESIGVPLTAQQIWRFENFGSIEDDGDGSDSADPDGDGRDNGDEFIAGTDPNDGSDYFKVKSILYSGTTASLKVEGRVGRVYTLERLEVGVWQSVVASGTVAVDEDVELMDSGASGGTGLYRVEVEYPE